MNKTTRELGKLGAGAIFALGLVIQHDHVYYNSTASAPIGYYWTSTPKHLSRGERVLVCMTPALLEYAERHGFREPPDDGSPCYHGARPFIKTVWGLPGDHLHVDRKGVSINGQLIEQTDPMRSNALDGAPMPLAQDTTVPADAVIAGSTIEGSFDSRYAGPLTVISRVKLIALDPFTHAEHPTAQPARSTATANR